MNSDGKIYITISDTRDGGKGKGGVNAAESKTEEDNELVQFWAKEKLLNTVRSLASTTTDYAINNIGNFTGNYIQQTVINNTLHTANSLKNIGLSTLAGFRFAGLYGGIFSAAISVINSAASSTLAIHTAMVSNRKINYEIEQLRDRAGMNVYKDGSRGTEN